MNRTKIKNAGHSSPSNASNKQCCRLLAIYVCPTSIKSSFGKAQNKLREHFHSIVSLKNNGIIS